MAAPPPFAEQLDLFAQAAAVYDEAASRAARARDDVVPNTLVCEDTFNLAVDGLLFQVEEYRGRWLAQVRLLSQEREKALGAQTDLLAVSAGQLAACVALGRAALASGDNERGWEAARTVEATEGLLAFPTRVCAGTRSAVVCDFSAAWACLKEGTRLQQFELDAARSSVSGEGLTVFVKGGAARNVIRVTCMDINGDLAYWATLEDADVGMTVNGAAWQVASAVFTDPGVLEVTYVVDEDGLEEMEVGVSLRGVVVSGGPWRPRAGFMAQGVLIATLPIQHMHHAGLAISSDGSLMVTCDTVNKKLDVYRTVDGSHVRSLGGQGTGPGKFDGYLCMTARDTVLVTDWGRKRIQEVTLEGVHVKSIQLDQPPSNVAVHGDVMAVFVRGGGIQLYSYTTGALMRKIEDVDYDVDGICFAPDGQHLAVGGSRVLLLSVHGQSARHIGPWGSWRGVAFTCTGDVIAVCGSGVSVISATDGMLLRSWAVAYDHFSAANGVRVLGNRLYVLHNGRVQVFE